MITFCQVEIINKKQFAETVIDMNIKAFKVYTNLKFA